MLREACRGLDSLDDMQALLDAEGITSQSSQGMRMHPALAELRQQRLALARLLIALRIPAGEVDDGRVQGRSGLRGVYGLAGDGA
jgi:hypothetical protein